MYFEFFESLNGKYNFSRKFDVSNLESYFISKIDILSWKGLVLNNDFFEKR